MANEYGIPMKFHRFNQFFLMPISMLGYIFELSRIFMNGEQYLDNYGSVITLAYVSFMTVTVVLSIVTQIGFIHLSGYSYFSYLLIQMLNMANIFFMYSYIYDKKNIYNMLFAVIQNHPESYAFTDTETFSLLANHFRTAMGFGIILGLAISVMIIFYYMKRRCVFNFKEPYEKKKTRNDLWANKERYVPERGVRMPRKDEKSVTNRRLTGMANNNEDNDKSSQSEPDIFDGLK